MRSFLINALSARGHCATVQEAQTIFIALINAVKYLRPMIKAERAQIFYEPCDHEPTLLPEQNLNQTLHQFNDKQIRDLRTLWFQHTTKERAKLKQYKQVQINIALPNRQPQQRGNAAQELIRADVTWLSFGGDDFNRANDYHVSVGNSLMPVSVKNAHDQSSLQELLPYFQHSDKHRDKPWFDLERKETVAAMPVRNEKEAGELLRCGLQDGDDIFAFHANRRQFFRFLQTGKNVYHGFHVEENEVPEKLRRKLRND